MILIDKVNSVLLFRALNNWSCRVCVVRSILFYANKIFYGFEDAPSNLSGFGAIFKLIQGKCYPKTMPYRMHRCQRDTAELAVYAPACIVCIRWEKNRLFMS